jgi:hypothetical protein
MKTTSLSEWDLETKVSNTNDTFARVSVPQTSFNRGAIAPMFHCDFTKVLSPRNVDLRTFVQLQIQQ